MGEDWVGFGVTAVLEIGRVQQLKDRFVGPAVDVAINEKWVSPGRLRNRVGISQRDARLVISCACNQGFLYLAQNGRYYPTNECISLRANRNTLSEESSKTGRRNGERGSTEQQSGLGSVMILLVLSAIIGTLVCVYNIK